MMRVNTDGSCVEPVNQAALLFNQWLMSSMGKIKAEMRGSNLVFVNSYNMLKEIIEHPSLHGQYHCHVKCTITIAIIILSNFSYNKGSASQVSTNRLRHGRPRPKFPFLPIPGPYRCHLIVWQYYTFR